MVSPAPQPPRLCDAESSRIWPLEASFLPEGPLSSLRPSGSPPHPPRPRPLHLPSGYPLSGVSLTGTAVTIGHADVQLKSQHHRVAASRARLCDPRWKRQMRVGHVPLTSAGPMDQTVARGAETEFWLLTGRVKSAAMENSSPSSRCTGIARSDSALRSGVFPLSLLPTLVTHATICLAACEAPEPSRIPHLPHPTRPLCQLACLVSPPDTSALGHLPFTACALVQANIPSLTSQLKPPCGPLGFHPLQSLVHTRAKGPFKRDTSWWRCPSPST